MSTMLAIGKPVGMRRTIRSASQVVTLLKVDANKHTQRVIVRMWLEDHRMATLVMEPKTAIAHGNDVLRGATFCNPELAAITFAELREAAEWALAYLTNVNVIEPSELAQKLIAILLKTGGDKDALDAAAIAMLRGAAHA